MSKGYGGKMVLFEEDEEIAIYRYGGENLNDETDTRGSIKELDGEILIYKRCLVEAEIRTKIKKTANHKKILVTKRIPQPFDYGEAMRNGEIEILKPCKSEDSPVVGLGGKDYPFATKLLFRLFTVYQEEGKLPKEIYFFV